MGAPSTRKAHTLVHVKRLKDTFLNLTVYVCCSAFIGSRTRPEIFIAKFLTMSIPFVMQQSLQSYNSLPIQNLDTPSLHPTAFTAKYASTHLSDSMFRHCLRFGPLLRPGAPSPCPAALTPRCRCAPAAGRYNLRRLERALVCAEHLLPEKG